MKPIAWARGALLVAGLACAGAKATPTTLDFDGAASADITNAYAGLTFSAPFPGTGPVRTWASTAADTPGNVLGLSGQNNFYAFNQSTGAIDILFSAAVSFVSIQAAFVQASDQFLGWVGRPFMSVYNSTTISAATRLGVDYWDIASDACLNSGGSFCTSGYDTLSFTSASADIKAIRLTGEYFTPSATVGLSRLAIFDTLTYDGANDSTVPEPTSALLTAAALLGLALTRRKSATVRRC
jgi:hypothetical protein